MGLSDFPFDYTTSKDGKMFITYRGKQIMILKNNDAAKLLRRIEGKSDDDVQLELAKVTKNFKRGNERLKSLYK